MSLLAAPQPEAANTPPAPASPGLSLVPAFARDGTVKHEELWWQHEGNRAIRVGDWKLVAAGRDGPWELYDLASDRTETKDLARRSLRKLANWRSDGNSSVANSAETRAAT